MQRSRTTRHRAQLTHMTRAPDFFQLFRKTGHSIELQLWALIVNMSTTSIIYYVNVHSIKIYHRNIVDLSSIGVLLAQNFFFLVQMTFEEKCRLQSSTT